MLAAPQTATAGLRGGRRPCGARRRPLARSAQKSDGASESAAGPLLCSQTTLRLYLFRLRSRHAPTGHTRCPRACVRHALEPPLFSSLPGCIPKDKPLTCFLTLVHLIYYCLWTDIVFRRSFCGGRKRNSSSSTISTLRRNAAPRQSGYECMQSSAVAARNWLRVLTSRIAPH